MAAKKMTSSAYDERISQLMKEIEKQKKDKKIHEDRIKQKIGEEYCKLVNLSQKDKDVESILADLEKEVKAKRTQISQEKKYSQEEE
ncbi:TPA: hypothetical protein ACQ0F8_002036 [Streptococcus agalactiae]|nr:hypothetical protein [Streptococcus agalactiae]HEO4177395.1 hypothetical protein [Streptococcus agalactiae]